MSEQGFVLDSLVSSLKRFYRRVGGSEEMLVDSNYVYGQERFRL